ncbi:MAG TPA: class I SAM-dependent methyltransferase [Terriglobales bacterium]|jgi:SAM-dependent methyltransferase|nr:class I SAM-dependent methyltransferase [Terriglobales bacterium]
MVQAQTWDPERYARNARFVADLGAPTVELLAPRAGERILDLGCGDGVLTAKLAAMGCHVVGVDSSAAQIDAARKLGLDARVMNGEALDFDSEFDAVFSNAALHWMRNPAKVIAGVKRALKPHGRFVGEFGGHGCVAKIKKVLVEALDRRGINGEGASPWSFPTVEEYSRHLTNGGFVINYIALIPRPTPLPGDITGWLETFAESFTSTLLPAQRSSYIAEVQEALRPELCDGEGRWVADYIRLRFAANKRV